MIWFDFVVVQFAVFSDDFDSQCLRYLWIHALLVLLYFI